MNIASIHQRKTKGFTLLELVVVVAIVAILSAIAVPSYLSYTLHGRRADAWAGLSQSQAILERCYTQTFDYSKVTVAGSGCGTLTATGNVSPQKFYTVAMTLPAASATSPSIASYTLTATPASGSPQQKDTQCASLTVTNANVRSALDSSGSDQTAKCWQQ